MLLGQLAYCSVTCIRLCLFGAGSRGDSDWLRQPWRRWLSRPQGLVHSGHGHRLLVCLPRWTLRMNSGCPLASWPPGSCARPCRTFLRIYQRLGPPVGRYRCSQTGRGHHLPARAPVESRAGSSTLTLLMLVADHLLGCQRLRQAQPCPHSASCHGTTRHRCPPAPPQIAPAFHCTL